LNLKIGNEFPGDRDKIMPDGTDSNIPSNLVEAIASSTAVSVGEQPAILANLALANQIANTNLAQQNAISNQQAMFQLELTIVSKCVELIANISPASSTAAQQLAAFQQVMQMFSQLSQSSINGPRPATPPQGTTAATPPAPTTTKTTQSGRARATKKAARKRARK
jgi:hypothetical protein